MNSRLAATFLVVIMLVFISYCSAVPIPEEPHHERAHVHSSGVKHKTHTNTVRTKRQYFPGQFGGGYSPYGSSISQASATAIANAQSNGYQGGYSPYGFGGGFSNANANAAAIANSGSLG